MKTKSQNQQIREWLEDGNAITPIEALKCFGCFRLSARIYDLRQEGMDIKSEIISRNNKQYACYYLQEGDK